MDPNKVILESLTSDLKRVALGLHRNSNTMATRFAKEALSRKSELNLSILPQYIKSLLEKLESSVTDPDSALTSSTLIQNYITHRAKFA